MKKTLLMIGVTALFGALIGCSGGETTEPAATTAPDLKPAKEGEPAATAGGKVPELSANPNGKLTEPGSQIGGK